MKEECEMATLKLNLSGLVLLGLLLFCSPAPTQSTTIEKESLESIVQRAHLVVWGNVVELQHSIKFERYGILRAKIDVLQVIKGKSVIDTVWAEGCSDKTAPENLRTLGLAKFQLGEQVIVCLI
jgi:hypothetical protein